MMGGREAGDRSRVTRLAATIGAAALVLSACAGGTAAPTTSGSAPAAEVAAQAGNAATGTDSGAGAGAAGVVQDPCSLLTVAEVEAANGGTGLSAKADHFDPHSASCSYLAADPLDNAHELSLVVTATPDLDAFQRRKAHFRIVPGKLSRPARTVGSGWCPCVPGFNWATII